MLYETFNLWNNNSLTVGTDLKQYGGTANQGKAANKLNTVNELSIYAYTRQQLFSKLSINAGLRLENNSEYGNELIPMVGFSYVLSNSTSFKASASKGFRSPTVMEMFLYAPNPDSVSYTHLDVYKRQVNCLYLNFLSYCRLCVLLCPFTSRFSYLSCFYHSASWCYSSIPLWCDYYARQKPQIKNYRYDWRADRNAFVVSWIMIMVKI